MVPGLILEEGGEEREGRKKEGGTEAGKKKGKEGGGWERECYHLAQALHK